MPSHEQTAQTASRLSDPVEFVAPAITFPRVSCAPYIWPQAADLPITKTVAEVDPIVTKPLLEAAARQDERFVQRPQRLTQRHPCIKTLDNESKDAVWIEGPPFDCRTERAVYVIGVQNAHLAAVVLLQTVR